MTFERLKEIASKGGKAAHQSGYAHEWTPEEAKNGLVYSLIGHRIGYSHLQEVSGCIHKRLP